MTTQHAKSPCCQEKILRFGKRRRQCMRCKRTWRIRQKRRGRKRLRIHPEYVQRYLARSSSCYSTYSARHLSYRQFNYRVLRSRSLFLQAEPRQTIPIKTRCVAVVDAMIHKVCGRYYTTYVVLIRPIEGTEAIIYEVLTFPDYENGARWMYLLTEFIPQELRCQIVALICDGARIFPRIAAQNNWLLQRCHFHLLATLHTRLSGKRMRKQWRRTGKRITSLIRIVLDDQDNNRVTRALLKLRKYLYCKKVPIAVRVRVISGFLKEYQNYRTYLNYPEFNLPKTSNSCEAVIRIIRRALSCMHGVNSPRALEQWIRAIVTKKKTIRCNGTKNQPNFCN